MNGIVTTFTRLPLSIRNFVLLVYLIFKNNGRTGNEWCLDLQTQILYGKIRFLD